MLKFKNIVCRNIAEALNELKDKSINSIKIDEYHQEVDIEISGGNKLKFYINNSNLCVDLTSYNCKFYRRTL